MPPRRVELVVSKTASSAVLELARTVKAALAAKYNARIRTVDEVDGEYVDADRTPVDFKPREAPLIIRIGEGDPTLT